MATKSLNYYSSNMKKLTNRKCYLYFKIHSRKGANVVNSESQSQAWFTLTHVPSVLSPFNSCVVTKHVWMSIVYVVHCVLRIPSPCSP